MTRLYFFSPSFLYCLILFIGGLQCNTAFLPSSSKALLLHHTTSLNVKQAAKSTPFKHQTRPDDKRNNNNKHRSTNKYYKNKHDITKKRNVNSKINKYKEFNFKLIKCNDASELLTLLGKYSDSAISKIGGGGDFNDVNFSTAFHRFATFLNQQPEKQQQKKLRSQILSDPRFAFLVCCTAEALSKQGDHTLHFQPRQLSNIIWSIAKLRIAPPKETYPLDVSFMVLSEVVEQCSKLRNNVHQVANDKVYNKFATSAVPWIPELAELCAIIVDMISYKASRVRDPAYFRFQEYSNILWAAATIQRCDLKMMTNVVDKLVKLGNIHLETIKNTKNNEFALQVQEEHYEKPREELKPQVLSNSLWSLATSFTFGPDEQLIQFVAELMESYPSFLNESSPQSLSNIVWSTATLLSKRSSPPCDKTNLAGLMIMRCISKEVIKRQGKMFKIQAVSNIAWAFATVGYGFVPATTSRGKIDNVLLQQASATTDGAMVLSANGPIEDNKLMTDAIKILADRANQILRYHDSQELSNIAWAMACLGQKDEHFLRRLGWELANNCKQHDRQQRYSLTLWALAKLEIYDKSIHSKITSRFLSVKPKTIVPQEVSNTLWALAKAKFGPENPKIFETTLLSTKGQNMSTQETIDDPITCCFALGANDLMSRPFKYDTQHICNILCSFVKVGVRHPDLFHTVASHLVGPDEYLQPNNEIRGLNQFSPQEISNLAWAFAKHTQIGFQSLSVNNNNNTLSSSGKLAAYKISAMDVGESLQQRLFSSIANTALNFHGSLSLFMAQELAITVWSFALLGLKHDVYLDKTQAQVLDRIKSCVRDKQRNPMTTFTPQGITNLLWGMAVLSKPLIPGLMDELSRCLVEQCKDPKSGEITIINIANKFHRQGLASLAWACAVHNQYPPDIIKIIHLGLLGSGCCDEPNDPTYLTKSIYNDNGMEYAMISSLLYLQLAMDLNDNNIAITPLPNNFPQAWIKKESTKSKKNKNMQSGDENIKTKSSKAKQEINLALDRIGFDHVENYMITMEMLVNEYGISSMSASSFEVFSIDLANVKEKIAIEVDCPPHFVASLNDNDNKKIDSNSKPIIMENKSSLLNKNNGSQEVLVGGRFKVELACWNRQEFNGGTLLKYRILEKLGWKVISIRVWDWCALENNLEKEDAYCRSLLGL